MAKISGENHKSNKILHLEREMVKKGIEKSANFAIISKVTTLFQLWKGPITPVHQCFFFPNTNGYLNWDTFFSSNYVMGSILAKRKSSVTNLRLLIITVSSKIL